MCLFTLLFSKKYIGITVIKNTTPTAAQNITFHNTDLSIASLIA